MTGAPFGAAAGSGGDSGGDSGPDPGDDPLVSGVSNVFGICADMSVMDANALQHDFSSKLDADLSYRTFHGTWGHPATLILVYFTTTLATGYPLGFWLTAAIVSALVLCRIPLFMARAQNSHDPRLWRWALIGNIFAVAAAWGLLNAYTCAHYGWESRNSTLLVLYISAIAGAGVHLLTQSVSLVAGYLVVLMGPLAVVAPFQGKQGVWLSVAVVFYFVYLVRQARSLNVQYWRQLRDNHALSTRANRDPLTGLANRLAFQEDLTAAVREAREEGAPVALVYIDLDRFKEVNDRFSHQVGDRFLCEVANRLRICCAARGTPFRLGGDEFTVLLRNGATAEKASQFALSVQEEFQRPMRIDGHVLTASASIGVSIFPEDCLNSDDLLRTADFAMYSAKAVGRGTYQIFRDARRTSRFSANDLELEIPRALETGAFDVHYQPQVNSHGELAGFEALLRWTHPVIGNIPPLDFIPLAEKTGLIVPLGFWVLRQVCEQGSAWRRDGIELVPMAVNVSPVQFDNPDFVDTLVAILGDTGFPPALLTLEITESMLLNQQEAILAQLKQIRTLGIRIAIDDFGTGYSSLSRINQFPVDVLKLDRTFISAIRNAGDGAPIVEAVLAMARKLDLDVVAEGIEIPAQYEVLSRMGCEVFQGYYFGKASRADYVRRHYCRRCGTEAVTDPLAAA